ncbi:MAG: hypothetical protein ACJ8C3_08950 [Microvirga sp.]|jgi:hypothetical protein
MGPLDYSDAALTRSAAGTVSRFLRRRFQFPLAHPVVASVGAVTPAEIARNIESLSRPIPVSLWVDLKTAGLLRSDTPTPA